MTATATVNATATINAAAALLPVALRDDALAWAAEGDYYAPQLAEQMTLRQGRVIAKITSARFNGIRLYVNEDAGKCVWYVHEEYYPNYQCMPSCYWERHDCNWLYESCTKNTHATVSRDGTVTGKTATWVDRLACQAYGSYQREAIDYVEANSVGGCLRSADLQRIVDVLKDINDQTMARKVAALAIDCGYPQWKEWNGTD